MKLSNRFAKLTSLKSLAVITVAGAALAAAAPAAQAQHFAVGVQLGGPRYYAPPPRFDRYDRYRYEEFRRHDDWRFRHEYRPYGYYR